MGNQQTGRTRSDTYTRYERDGEDGRYVTLEHHDSTGTSGHLSSFDGRVRISWMILLFLKLFLDLTKT